MIGKVTLMAVGHPLVRNLERIAPGEELPSQATARRKFPFRFRRQALAGPARICERVFIRHVNNRPSFLPLDRTRRAGWMTPVHAWDVTAPFRFPGRPPDRQHGDWA